MPAARLTPYDLVVVCTLGQQDLQVLAVDEGGGLKRLSPRKAHVGPLHQAILRARPAYPLWLPAAGTLAEERQAEALFEDGGVRLPAGLRPAGQADLPGSAAPQGVTWLTFGLLGPALRQLEEEVRTGKVTRPLLLLLHTDRGPADPWSQREPVAAAPLLADWLGEHLRPADPQRDIRSMPVLQAGERLTEQDPAGNTRLNAAVAGRIDEALRQAAGECATGAVRLHVAGGIPEVGRVVEASARFRFPSVQQRSPSEDTAATGTGPTPTPVEVLHARQRIRDLVRQGQLEAAALLAGVLAPPLASPAGLWQRCLAAVADYLHGYRERASQAAGQLGGAATAGWLGQVLDACQPRCLLVALRAEAVLRAGDVCQGAALTGTFLDVAVFDAVARHLDGGSGACVQWDRVCLRPDLLSVSVDQLRAVARPLHGYRPNRIFCKQAWLEAWLQADELRLEQAWQKWLLADAVGQLGGAPGVAAVLLPLCERLYAPTPAGLVLAYFRNQVIHSLPQDDGAIRQHRDAFVAGGLWRRQGSERFSFLAGNTLPAQVLQALGTASPEQVYEAGVAALVADIESCPLV
jgi:hypothetical protein